MIFYGDSFILSLPAEPEERSIKMKKQYIAVPCSYLHDEKKQYAILKRGEPVILAYAENLMEAIEISRFLEETEKEDEER